MTGLGGGVENESEGRGSGDGSETGLVTGLGGGGERERRTGEWRTRAKDGGVETAVKLD